MTLIPSLELQSKEKIKNFQEHRLKELVQYLQLNSLFYRRHFEKYFIDVRAIEQLEDLQQIPPTTKDDLQQNNWDFLCVPKNKIIEYTSTSGTLGKPVTIPLTENDLQRLGYNECISFACANGNDDDLYQLMLTLDRQFMAGMAYYEGIKKLGASMVRVGPGLPALQWETIERLKPTALVAVPSFIVKLLEYAHQHGIDPNKSSVKKAVCIGESLRTAALKPNMLATKITQAWDLELYSTYASTEMQTAFTECVQGHGGHHHPELIILEILDDANKPVKAGEPGAVTITTLGVEAMPLLRYKTGDVAAFYDEPCRCGRNTLRVGPVLGRQQQMIKLKGTTLYPPGVFDIINQVSTIKDYVVEVYSNEFGTDELRVHLFTSDSDNMRTELSLQSLFQSRLRVMPIIQFATQQAIEQLQSISNSRKPTKFLDTRK